MGCGSSTATGRETSAAVDDADPELVPEYHRIEDLGTWLANNALRNHEDDVDDGGGRLTLDQQEALERFREHADYQQKLFDGYFAISSTSNSVDPERRETLRRFESQQFCLLAGPLSLVSIPVPLHILAESCETIYAAAARHGCKSLSLGNEYSVEAIQHLVGILLNKAAVNETPDDLVVDCCRLAHYLQNACLLEQYSQILLESVDTSNCVSLAQLAYQLRLPTLFERALSHVMDSSLDQKIQEQIPVLWTQEFRDRFAAIQAAIQSSIHNSQRSKLYFSSFQEYLAIFAERVQYYRERLATAKEQRDELLFLRDQQQNMETNTTLGRRPLLFATNNMITAFVSLEYLQDIQTKIERQEQRLRTLEIALAEQKETLRQYY